MLNITFNHFYCKIRKSFCTGEDTPGYYNVIVVGAQSRPGHAITFHVITEIGGMRSRVPLHALCWKECDPKELSELCLWDCFGEHVTCTSFDYLQQSRVNVMLRSGHKEWGVYMMSFDWFDNGFSDEPSQYKIMHLIKLESGHYALQPNNRLRWHDSSFITDEDTTKELKTWKVDQKSYSAEMGSRWAIKGDEFFYSTQEEQNIIDVGDTVTLLGMQQADDNSHVVGVVKHIIKEFGYEVAVLTNRKKYPVSALRKIKPD